MRLLGLLGVCLLVSGCRQAQDPSTTVTAAYENAAATLAYHYVTVELSPVGPVRPDRKPGDRCDNCTDGRSGDGHEICPVCNGDTIIDEADLNPRYSAAAADALQAQLDKLTQKLQAMEASATQAAVPYVEKQLILGIRETDADCARWRETELPGLIEDGWQYLEVSRPNGPVPAVSITVQGKRAIHEGYLTREQINRLGDELLLTKEETIDVETTLQIPAHPTIWVDRNLSSIGAAG